MKKFIAIILGIAIVVGGLFAGANSIKNHHSSSNKTTRNATSSSTKYTSYAKQAKDGTNHLWLVTNSSDENGVVKYVITLANSKETTYRILDDDATLKKLSSMNDSQLLNYAKKQDKAYFDSGYTAAKNSSNSDNSENGYTIGQNTEFKNGINVPRLSYTILESGYNTFNPTFKGIAFSKDYSSDGTYNPSNFDYMLDAKGNSIDPNNTNNYDTDGGLDPTALITDSDSSDSDDKAQQELTNRFKKALLKTIKQTKYQAPEAVSITTHQDGDDDSSSTITTSFTYKYNYADGLSDNIDKVDIPKLISLLKANKSVRKTYIDAAKYSLENVDSDPNKKSRAFFDGLTSDTVMDSLTKGSFGNFNKSIDLLLTPINQFKVNNKAYAGYNNIAADNDNDFDNADNSMYLVTKISN